MQDTVTKMHRSNDKTHEPLFHTSDSELCFFLSVTVNRVVDWGYSIDVGLKWFIHNISFAEYVRYLHVTVGYVVFPKQ